MQNYKLTQVIALGIYNALNMGNLIQSAIVYCQEHYNFASHLVQKLRCSFLWSSVCHPPRNRTIAHIWKRRTSSHHLLVLL